MRDIRLIVTDLDGTFLNGYRSFHPDNAKAIRAAQEAGSWFAPAPAGAMRWPKAPS